MNDKDIIKALRCCSETDCRECPLNGENMCVSKVTGFALDLIKRQQAEIERLSKFATEERCREIAQEMILPLIKKVKEEAVEDFIEMSIWFVHYSSDLKCCTVPFRYMKSIKKELEKKWRGQRKEMRGDGNL